MNYRVLATTLALVFSACSFAWSQGSPNGSNITAPTQNQEFEFGVTSITIEGTITLADSVANVVTTWPTGQVTTAQVSYGAGSSPDEWIVINCRKDAQGNPTGDPMYEGNYTTELVNTTNSNDVWDTRDYKVLEEEGGGPVIE